MRNLNTDKTLCKSTIVELQGVSSIETHTHPTHEASEAGIRIAYELNTEES